MPLSSQLQFQIFFHLIHIHQLKISLTKTNIITASSKTAQLLMFLLSFCHCLRTEIIVGFLQLFFSILFCLRELSLFSFLLKICSSLLRNLLHSNQDPPSKPGQLQAHFMHQLLQQLSTSSPTNVTYFKLADVINDDVVYICPTVLQFINLFSKQYKSINVSPSSILMPIYLCIQ